MASRHSEPKLLYSIQGIAAYHIANGKEEPLTPAGPQTLSLLMVPALSAFADASQIDPDGRTSEDDFYLHLHLPPELDLPLPATTQIYHKPPTSYLIPRWDLGRDSGAFTRIEFPAAGSRPGLQEDVDTFETILAQCTAFLERAPPPQTSGEKKSRSGKDATDSKGAMLGEDLPSYNPADYKPGEGYAKGSHSSVGGGQIVLVDEEDGSVIGELGDGFHVVEHEALMPGNKDPVQITLPADNSQNISVGPAPPEYAEMLMHPAYQKSFLVSHAALASRFIVTSSDFVSRNLQSRAATFTQTTKPAENPLTFNPSTREHIRRINKFSEGAAGLSSKTVGHIGKVAQNLGATLALRSRKAGKGGGGGKGFDADGNPIADYKPGILNKSLMAFSTVADGIEQAGRTLLTSTQSAATTVVSHKWGSDAGEVSQTLAGGFKNVALVYIDVTGVSRRAVIKSVAKGMVIGHVSDGREVVVGGGDGGQVELKGAEEQATDASSIGTRPDGKMAGNGKS